ncbi:MAG TPA: hypothetical protein VKT22_08515 [Steroidobacteraceae bacterium]|nr:hypothetical protein [Steroidobacteraceae bacterium]
MRANPPASAVWLLLAALCCSFASMLPSLGVVAGPLRTALHATSARSPMHLSLAP